jgi:hypothetical protein
MEEGRGVCRVLVGKSKGKRPLGKLGCRWEDNIKMDLQKVGYEDIDWIGLAQGPDRWRGTCDCCNEFSVSIKCGEFIDYLQTG